MILDGYQTIVGSKFKRTDNVETTLKTLSTTNRLTQLSDQGVFGVTYENGEAIPSFVFPITVKNFKGQTITVFDQRHYTNKNDKIVNGPEYNMMFVASVLQQQVATGNRSVLSSGEFVTTKAFAKAVAGYLGPQANLTLAQKIELEIILAHYFVCLLSNADDDYAFISQNVVKKALRYSPQISAPIIGELGYIGSLGDLIKLLQERDSMPTMRKLDTGAFIAIINRTWFVSSGFKMITGAAAEVPHLFTAICYATATNNMYKKTAIGQVLEVKNTPEVEAFVKMINSAVY